MLGCNTYILYSTYVMLCMYLYVYHARFYTIIVHSCDTLCVIIIVRNSTKYMFKERERVNMEGESQWQVRVSHPDE